jgi:hypothetical protein
MYTFYAIARTSLFGGGRCPTASNGREPGGCGGAGWCVIPRACALRLSGQPRRSPCPTQPRARARGLRRRWLVRHPAGLRLAAEWATASFTLPHSAPGASPGAAAALVGAASRGLAWPPLSPGREPGGRRGAGWCVIPRARALRLSGAVCPMRRFGPHQTLLDTPNHSRFVRRSRIHGLQITLGAEVHEKPAGFPQRPHPSPKRRCARPCRSLGQRRLSHLGLRRKSRAPPVRLRPRGAT